MENFSFKNPTDIRFGKDRIDSELRDVIISFGKNVLLVYGGQSVKRSGLYDRVIKALDGLNITELPGIEPNPKIDSVRKGQQLVKDNNIDVILAVGGGSVIDASKVIGSARYYEGDPWDLVLDSDKRMTLNQLPLVDILTLSATGSEMNRGSVISNPETHQKFGTGGPNTPAVSFLDPSLTFTVPTRQTAAGSMDIMSHLIEQYFDRSINNDVSKGLIEGLMRSVIKWAPVAIKEPDNYDARANLMWNATMALNGIVGLGDVNNWTVHPMEHELSAYYDITHGVGLGILTPRWLKAVQKDPSTHELLARFAKNVWGINNSDEDEAGSEAIKETYNWISSLGFEMTLPEVGIKDETNFDAMAESAVTTGDLSKNGYIKLTPEDVKNIYRDSMTPENF